MANIEIQDSAAPAKVSAKVKLSAADKKIAAELVDACETANESLEELSSYQTISSQRVMGEYAVGRCSLVEAITAAVVQGDSGKAIIQKLRSACKGAIRSAENQLGKFVIPVEQAKAAEAAAAAAELEKSERAAAEKAGVVYLPSATLESYLSAKAAAETRVAALEKGARVSHGEVKALL